MAVNLNFGGWVRVARTLASHRGFGIRYVSEEEIERHGAQAWNDGRFAYIRQPQPGWSDEQFKLWLYLLVHETGHSTPKRRGAFDILKEKKVRGFLGYVFNVTEDHVQERDLFNDEPSLRKILNEGRHVFYKTMIAKTDDAMLERLQTNPAGPCLYGWDAGHRTDFQPLVTGYDRQFHKPVKGDDRVKLWLERLNDGDYATVLKNNPTVEETFELSERICREVFEIDPEDLQGEPQPSDEEGEGDGEGKGQGNANDNDGEGEQGDAASKGTDSNGGESQPGAGEGEGDGKGKGEPADGAGKLSKEEGEFDYEDLLGHNHATDPRVKEEAGGGCTINYDEFFSNGASTHRRDFMPDFDNLNVYNCHLGEYPMHDHRNSNDEPGPSMLSRKVARYMQAHSKNKRLHGQKQGKVSGKNLYRLKVKGMGEARKRVFNQRVVNKSKDVAVTIGIDLSGSMDSYGKTPAAIAAVTHLHEVISKTLRIPLEIAGFSVDSDNNGAHVVFQPFGKPRRTEEVTEDLRRTLAFNGANRDGEFLLWARDRLLAQPAARHIMIVLSDGQPVHSGAGDVATFTRDVCQQIDADPRLEMHGIGILSEAVHHFYSSCDVIQSVDELEEKLLTVLKNKIIIDV